MRRSGVSQRGTLAAVMMLVTALCGLLIGLSAAPSALAGDTFQATPRPPAVMTAPVGDLQPPSNGSTLHAAPGVMVVLGGLLLLALYRRRGVLPAGPDRWPGRRLTAVVCRGPPIL